MPRHSVGVVIGRSGEMIKKIQSDAGVKIQFKPGERSKHFHENCIKFFTILLTGEGHLIIFFYQAYSYLNCALAFQVLHLQLVEIAGIRILTSCEEMDPHHYDFSDDFFKNQSFGVAGMEILLLPVDPFCFSFLNKSLPINLPFLLSSCTDDGTGPDKIAHIMGPPDQCQHAASIITDLLQSIRAREEGGQGVGTECRGRLLILKCLKCS